MFKQDADYIHHKIKQAKKVKRGRRYEALCLYYAAGERLKEVRTKLNPANYHSQDLLHQWLNKNYLSPESCISYLKLFNYWWLLQQFRPNELKDMTLTRALKVIEELRWSKLGEREKPSWLEAKKLYDRFFITYG